MGYVPKCTRCEYLYCQERYYGDGKFRYEIDCMANNGLSIFVAYTDSSTTEDTSQAIAAYRLMETDCPKVTGKVFVSEEG